MPMKWYIDTMTTTIDKAGRVVIPAAVRERLGLLPGTRLSVSIDEAAVRLTPAVSPPVLVRRKGLLVARPTVDRAMLPKVDVSALIEEERNRWP
jgi:AbrB family looped-hinge helix DNA binding protein